VQASASCSQVGWRWAVGWCSWRHYCGADNLSTPTRIEIPAQTLAGALTALANQVDLQIVFRQELGAGLPATAISGQYSAAEVPERLLVPANLEAVVRRR